MKFRLMSDLHLEFEERIEDFTPTPLQDDMGTVLILAGDIATGTDAAPFIKRMCRQFYHVIYVLGNHEFYYTEYHKLRKRWAGLKMPKNFTLLDNHTFVLDGARFVGGTLWTDFNGGDWFAMNLAQHGMADYDCIKIKEGNKESGYRKRQFLPADAVRAHKETLFNINETIRVPHDGPTIVITHHLPHPLCVAAAFKVHPLNPAYVTNLDEVIEEYDIDVWIHGHTHDNVDVEVHGTRILCNPRGYVGYELNKDFDEKFTFEL